MQNIKVHAMRVLRFSFAGTAGTVTHLLSFHGLTVYLEFWYLTSSVATFLMGTGVAFWLQKFWTFGNTERSYMKTQLGLYLAMKLAFLGINTICLYGVVEHTGVRPTDAQLVILVVLGVPGFFMCTWIFRARQKSVLLP